MFINIIIYNVYPEAIIYDIFRPVNPSLIIQFKVDIYYSRFWGGGRRGVQAAMKNQTFNIYIVKFPKRSLSPDWQTKLFLGPPLKNIPGEICFEILNG